MPFRDRGSIPVLPVLRLNWARNGWRFRITSHTWHIRLPLIGGHSKNIRHDTGSSQYRWDHPLWGWYEGKRKRKKGKR